MGTMTIIALIIAIPIILLPVALVWYLNIGGIVHAVHEAKVAKANKVATVTTTIK